MAVNWRIHYWPLLLLTGLLYCKSNDRDPSTGKPSSSYDDTITVTGNAAVFFYPDSAQLTRIRAVSDSNQFNAQMHEFEFLDRNASRLLELDFPRIPVIRVKSHRYILFVKNSGDSCIDLNQIGDPVGLFIFKPSKDPRLVDLPNAASELSAYFLPLNSDTSHRKM